MMVDDRIFIFIWTVPWGQNGDILTYSPTTSLYVCLCDISVSMLINPILKACISKDRCVLPLTVWNWIEKLQTAAEW